MSPHNMHAVLSDRSIDYCVDVDVGAGVIRYKVLMCNVMCDMM
jgi:hypothetical protein